MASDPDSRILLIMRHGKAEASAPSDHARPLADKGRSQAGLVGEYLESQGVRPGQVLVSSAQRTRETWDAVLGSMPGFEGSVEILDDIYEGGPDEVLQLIRALDDRTRVALVVGHEPTMSALTDMLAGEDSDPGSAAQARIGLPTGALCVLSGGGLSWSDIAEDSLTLHTVVRS